MSEPAVDPTLAPPGASSSDASLALPGATATLAAAGASTARTDAAPRRFLVTDGDRVVEIPLPMNSLADFRAWATADDFPVWARAAYLHGSIEVDMSPEEFFGHSFPKAELSAQLHLYVKQRRLGYVFSDGARVTNAGAELSVEPDLFFFSHETLAKGRVRFVPRVRDRPGSVELEGSPDLVVEIVSDSSAEKDRRLLYAAYFAAGVREYWLLDARGAELEFHVFTRGERDWLDTAPDGEGFRRSSVLPARFRLDRTQNAIGHPEYDLRVVPID